MHGTQMLNHQHVDINLLVDSPDHHFFIHRLIRASNEIPVEVHVEVVQPVHTTQRDEREVIIHIEAVLRHV